MKSIKYFALFSILTYIVPGCNPNTLESKPTEDREWKKEFQSRLSLFGHRNWILIVDKAFPMQNGSGISVINSNEGLLPVLTYVLGEIDSSSHVKPIIYQDKELSFITEAQSNGVGELRESLKKVFGNQKVQQIMHDSVFFKIDEAAKLFNVLIIKTNETIAYSSVFLQLDCAYWNEENERTLRSVMMKNEQIPE
jgi:D-ribose pyranose/furanose isomerase RbsD